MTDYKVVYKSPSVQSMPEQKLRAKKDAEEKERKEYENDIAQKLA